jgi:hypothetical protein
MRVGLGNQGPIDFFVGTDTLPPLFGDLSTSSLSKPMTYHLSLETANWEAKVANTTSFRRCGAWDIVKHAIPPAAVGAGTQGDNEVERKEGGMWRRRRLALRWGTTVGAGMRGDDEVERKEGVGGSDGGSFAMGLERNRPSPVD